MRETYSLAVVEVEGEGEVVEDHSLQDLQTTRNIQFVVCIN